MKIPIGHVALMMFAILTAAAADSPAPVEKSTPSNEAAKANRQGLVKAANGSWVTVEEKNALDAAAQAVAKPRIVVGTPQNAEHGDIS